MTERRHLVVLVVAVTALAGALWFGWSDIQRFVSDKRVDTTTTPAASQAAPPAAPTAMVTAVGTAPGTRLRAESGRLYAGAAWTTDGGQTWTPLRDAAGKSAALLGGSRAVDVAVAPDGRVLLGEAMIETPGEAVGQGEIVHAVEWSPEGWHTLVRAQEDPHYVLFKSTGHTRTEQIGPNTYRATATFRIDPVPPRIPVRSVIFRGDGHWVVAMNDSLLFDDGELIRSPGDTRSLVSTSNGSLYLIANPVEGLLYRASPGSRTFVPVGGTGRVNAVTETAAGAVLLINGPQHGVLGGEEVVKWLPMGVPSLRDVRTSFDHVVGDRRSTTVIAWNRSTAYASNEAGTNFARLALPDGIVIESAAVDPVSSGSGWIVDRSKTLYRVHF